jgi:hypothetical protein
VCDALKEKAQNLLDSGLFQRGGRDSKPEPAAVEGESVLGHEAEEAAERGQKEAKSATAGRRAIASEARALPIDPVEQALSEALLRASRAEAWDTVQILTEELRARRTARAGVVSLEAERLKRR